MLNTPKLFDNIIEWSNLLQAYRQAAKHKRKQNNVSRFDFSLANELLLLQHELRHGHYQPGAYTQFVIKEPKLRLISAAPFRDRVVHHALCNQIEPIFEKRFIHDSYANRKKKGTHRAIRRFQVFARQFTYCLRLDICKHFQSIDHAILLNILAKQIDDAQTLALIRLILGSGEECWLNQQEQQFFAGDDLLSLCRAKGLPIGNLTSQFWSNCYLHPLDMFVKRQLGCNGYLRYVDDFALFSDSKQELWQWKSQINGLLASLRLRFHPHSAQVPPVSNGTPWLGMVIYPNHIRVKSRKVKFSSRKLRNQYNLWQLGHISFAEFDAAIQGWINYVRYADSWGLRQHVLSPFILNKPG